MPAYKGHKKVGGRKKGTPNKKSLDFGERLTELNFDLIDEIIALVKDTTPGAPSKSQKLSSLIHMLNFIYPTRKSLALAPEDEQLLKQIKAYQQMAEKDLKEVVHRALGTAHARGVTEKEIPIT
jgi:hypothetical protein